MIYLYFRGSNRSVFFDCGKFLKNFYTKKYPSISHFSITKHTHKYF